MKDFIAKHLKYPPQAAEKKIEGSVTMRLTIDHKGKVSNVQIVQHLGHGCDEEAIRVAGLLEFEVDPPRGLKITYHRKLTIHFKLPKVVTKPKQPVQQTMQGISYTYSSASSATTSTDNAEKASKSYHYTININNK